MSEWMFAKRFTWRCMHYAARCRDPWAIFIICWLVLFVAFVVNVGSGVENYSFEGARAPPEAQDHSLIAKSTPSKIKLKKNVTCKAPWYTKI